MDFVRLIDCFRLGRRVRLGISMVSIKNCGLVRFIPMCVGCIRRSRLLKWSCVVYPGLREANWWILCELQVVSGGSLLIKVGSFK